MKYLITASALLSVAAMAGAQSYNSFHSVGSLYGVSISHSGNTLSVTLNSGAYIKVGSTDYSIVNAFGVWSLDGTGTLGSSFSGGTQNTNWGYNSKDASGKGIAGWEDPSKAGTILTPGGGTMSFNYTTSNFAKVTGYGLHVTLNSNVAGWDGGPTYFVTGTPAAVPEPMSMGALGLGIVGLIRRKRNKV